MSDRPSGGEPVRIVVDAAESRSEVYRRLADLPEVAIETARLPVGDYLLGGDLAVERKTTEDFAASIVDGRLFGQVAALVDAYARPVILLEGASPPSRSRIDPRALRGALSYLVAIAGVSVLRTEGAEESALLLAQMARHAQRGLPRPPAVVAKPRAAALAERQERIVAALPGVGPNLARHLLAHFGTPSGVLAAPAAALREVAGIGPVRAAAIRQLLDAVYVAPTGAEADRPGVGWLVPREADDARRRRRAKEGRDSSGEP